MPSQAGSIAVAPRSLLQRKCACGGSPGPDSECAECQKKPLNLQRKAAGRGAEDRTVPPITHEVLHSPGQPLEEEARSFMESRFGHDFSRVRVHTDTHAAEAAQAVNALAYTLGCNVVFGAGQYEPHTREGRRLLAHELTHVVQQNGSPVLQRQVDEPEPGPEEAAPSPEEGESPSSESEEEEIAAEAVESLPEAVHASADPAPEEELAEEESVAASLIGSPPSGMEPLVIAPSHPSEREAEVVSRAIVSESIDSAPPFIHCSAPAGGRFVQRQIDWDARNPLEWADFAGRVPRRSQFAALTYTEMRPLVRRLSPQEEVRPSHPLFPTPCRAGRRNDTEFSATVSFNLDHLKIHALMHPSRSWVRVGQQTPRLLAHEQGHFGITHEIAEKTSFAWFFWAISHSGTGTGCGSGNALNAARRNWNTLGANRAMQTIFNSGGDALSRAQDDYDNQTDHGLRSAEQRDWQGKINASLLDYDVPQP